MLNKECCYFVNTQPELRSAQPTKLPTGSRPIHDYAMGGAWGLTQQLATTHRPGQGQLGRKIAVATPFFCGRLTAVAPPPCRAL